jgi:hypothetical protein
MQVWPKMFGIFYGHLAQFTAAFGTVSDSLVYFSCFGMFGPRRIWQLCLLRTLVAVKTLLFSLAFFSIFDALRHSERIRETAPLLVSSVENRGDQNTLC